MYRSEDAYTVTYTYGTTPYTLAFNFCGYTPNLSKCLGNQDFGTLTYSNTCASITGSSLDKTESAYYGE